ARCMESRIRAAIQSWNMPAVRDVRGLGLLLGIELDPACFTVPEGKTLAMTVVMELFHSGLLVPAAGPNTIRLLPPLNVSSEEIDEALAILEQTLRRLITG
ncbi:MAG: aminotransferase class III-fold pyridoxal phosphate-dependent enzyme, partial [Luteolibacter sp.]